MTAATVDVVTDPDPEAPELALPWWRSPIADLECACGHRAGSHRAEGELAGDRRPCARVDYPDGRRAVECPCRDLTPVAAWFRETRTVRVTLS